MKAARILAVAALIVGGGLALNVAQSQQPGVTRSDLLQHDLSVPGREVIQARVDLGPTAPLVKHIHPARRSSTSWKGRWSTRSTASRPGPTTPGTP
jgi:hypothetical protein